MTTRYFSAWTKVPNGVFIMNIVIMFICNMFIAFNIVHRLAASYKESITDYTKSKTKVA